jgi:hypothetical protein
MTQEMHIVHMGLNIYGPMLTRYMIVYFSLLIGIGWRFSIYGSMRLDKSEVQHPLLNPV